MSEIQDLVLKASKELAAKHAEIIEHNCQLVCETYDCNPDQLILEFKTNTEISIKISTINFMIRNIFTVDGKDIKENE